jgi:hypothetical protein
MSKVLQFTNKETKDEEERRKWIKESLVSWSEMDDLKELVIIGFPKDGGFRYQIPIAPVDSIYVAGCLDNLRDLFQQRANLMAVEYDSDEE